MTIAEERKPLAYSLAIHFGIVLFAFVRPYFSSEIKPFEKAIRVDVVAMPDKFQKIIKPKIKEKKEVVKKKPKEKPKKKAIEKVQKDAAKIIDKNTKKVSKKKLKPNKKDESEMSAFQKLAALKAQKQEEELEEKQKNIAGNRASKGTDLVGVEKIEYSNYKSTLHSAISAEWDLPKWLLEGDLKAEAHIKIDEDGNLIYKKITMSSGNTIYDETVMGAIVNSAPFSPPPEKFKKIVYYEGVRLAFP